VAIEYCPTCAAGCAFLESSANVACATVSPVCSMRMASPWSPASSAARALASIALGELQPLPD
jgi:hypothetical protein